MRGVVFARFLDSVGDGTGETNAIGNYSRSPTSFMVRPVSSKSMSMEVFRLFVHLEFAGNPLAARYGRNIRLANGISVTINSSSGEITSDLTDKINIKANSGWGRAGVGLDVHKFGKNTTLTAGMILSEFGGPLVLGENESLRVNLEDDFRSLVSHMFVAKGGGDGY